jgi:predicted dehydrogenase
MPNNTNDANTNPHLTRRDALKLAGLTAATAAGMTAAQADAAGAKNPSHKPPKLAAPPKAPYADKPIENVRVGFVGVGGMGSAHVRNLLRIKGVQLSAACDIRPSRVKWAQSAAKKAGQPIPTGYSKGPTDFVRMCETEDLDLVYTATPWRWHAPVMLAAMKNGKHAATEVPATTSVEECWQLVEAAEKYKRHCVMMENCCYPRDIMMVLNMVRKGLLGDIVNGMGAYNHDLRGVKFSPRGEGLWRRDWSVSSNGNLYPTHGLGPIAQCMNISRGDRFKYLVSMSSPAVGLAQYQKKRNFKPSDPRSKETYALGDVNTSLIKTELGKTITLVHDTNLPRPYTRYDLIQGTKGIYQGFPSQIHIEGRTKGHGWEKIDKYMKEFEHPLWKNRADKARGAGHGGMDYMEDWRLIRCLQKGTPTDTDVYEAADWSVIFELTMQSVANGSAPINFPDFTRGAWKTRPQLGIVW